MIKYWIAQKAGHKNTDHDMNPSTNLLVWLISRDDMWFFPVASYLLVCTDLWWLTLWHVHWTVSMTTALCYTHYMGHDVWMTWALQCHWWHNYVHTFWNCVVLIQCYGWIKVTCMQGTLTIPFKMFFDTSICM